MHEKIWGNMKVSLNACRALLSYAYNPGALTWYFDLADLATGKWNVRAPFRMGALKHAAC